ncbi:MAG TPA: hypothetical protein VFV34_01875, partial [Blastocatellia bacterium]|nr:hypothetical protein [Blastocatellia bacterium]
ELDQGFIKRELERRARNEKRGKRVDKEDYEFYDITSWSLPLAFGVEAYWTEDAPSVKSARVDGNAVTFSPSYKDPAGSQLKAADGQPLPGTGGSVEGGRAGSAYIMPYGSDAAARLAIALLREGFKLAVATRQLNANGRNWPSGTLVARVHRNPDTLHARVAALAVDTGARVIAAHSAFADEGDTGIGSESVVSLKQPRVAVVWDEGASPTSVGAMWFTLERGYSLEFTPITFATLKSVDLSKFNVIVLPDGSPGAFQSSLGKEGIDKLRGWVSAGGVLIGIGGGATMLANKDVNLSSSRLVGEEEQPATSTQPSPQPSTQPAPGAPAQSSTQSPPAGQKEKKGDQTTTGKPEEKPAEKKKPTEPIAVPGSAFRARLDRDHFLSYGYGAGDLVVLMGGDTFFKPSKEGANVVKFAAEGQLLVSGFEWPDNTEELLKGTSYLIDEPTGRGHIILFAEDPNFRYLWRSSTQLFLNAILLASAL